MLPCCHHIVRSLNRLVHYTTLVCYPIDKLSAQIPFTPTSPPPSRGRKLVIVVRRRESKPAVVGKQGGHALALKSISSLLISLLLVLTTCSAFAQNAAVSRATELQGRDKKTHDSKGRLLYKPGELLVRFKKGTTEEQVRSLHHGQGNKTIGKNERMRLHRVKLKEGVTEEEAIKHYAASPLVELVERHALRYPNKIPNDPYLTDQWALQSISLPKAWDFAQECPEIIIAVIDTGLDYVHPDLSENIWVNTAEKNGTPGVDDDGNGFIDDVYGWDFADGDATPLDVFRHGTHVAGIIGAKGNNEEGVAGVCWTAKLMALKVQADGAEEMDDLAIINALEYAMDQGARVVNCSFGGEASSQIESDAFAELQTAGILTVCASGNDGKDIDGANQATYPASYAFENILTVAASNQTGSLAYFSNYGLSSVDIMAPGAGIMSTMPTTAARESSVTVKTASGTTTYVANAILYAGVTDSAGITATAYYCGLGYPQDFPPEVSGNIALIQRGTLLFSEKVTNAQNAGALAAIIYNNVLGDPASEGWTLGQAGNWIPAVSLTKAEGEAIQSLGTPLVTVVNKVASSAAAYAVEDGTSMAAPYVSGVAGLILSKNSQMRYTAVKSTIMNKVDLVPSVAGKIVSGGKINALAALCSTNTVAADLTFDHQISLADAILSFQILSGLTNPVCSPTHAPNLDVNGDGKIGMEEVIYLLQEIGGIR
jgi:subtilisin family serine protease